MVAMEQLHNQYLGGDSSLTVSPETQTKIDEMVVALVKKQHDKAYKLLEDNITKLHEITKFLYERETITGGRVFGDFKPEGSRPLRSGKRGKLIRPSNS